MAEPWPTELKLGADRRSLTVSFESGESFVLDAEYLRVTSPQRRGPGALAGRAKTVPGKCDVQILKVETGWSLRRAVDLRRPPRQRHLHLGLSP